MKVPLPGGEDAAMMSMEPEHFCQGCGRRIEPLEIFDSFDDVAPELVDPEKWWHRSCAKRENKRGTFPKNVAESECGHDLVSRGFDIHRTGYPDFWCLDREGHLSFVEVKLNRYEKFTAEQAAFLRIARAHGIRTFRYDPSDGLQEMAP